MIHACEGYAVAMFEKLAQWNGLFSDNRHFVEIGIPRSVSYEVATPEIVPGWDLPDCLASRNFGSAWYEDERSAVLFVPSIVARLERNVVINSLHPESGTCRCRWKRP